VAESTCEIELPDPPDSPVAPDDVAVQVKVVPGMLLERATEVDVPEQIDAEEGVAVAVGFGSTVTVMATGVPGQEFAVGVTLYVTVPDVVPVAVRIWAIELPLPAEPPEAPVCTGDDQLNVVPATPLLRVMLDAAPEQIVWPGGVANTFGTGFTFTVTVTGLPGQPAAEGVTV
jgi:hypothetical protein